MRLYPGVEEKRLPSNRCCVPAKESLQEGQDRCVVLRAVSLLAKGTAYSRKSLQSLLNVGWPVTRMPCTYHTWSHEWSLVERQAFFGLNRGFSIAWLCNLQRDLQRVFIHHCHFLVCAMTMVASRALLEEKCAGVSGFQCKPGQGSSWQYPDTCSSMLKRLIELNYRLVGRTIHQRFCH